jgi:hypothetical protein
LTKESPGERVFSLSHILYQNVNKTLGKGIPLVNVKVLKEEEFPHWEEELQAC